MSHYTIDYSTDTEQTREEKDQKAIDDCLEYLGPDRFERCVNLAKEQGSKAVNFAFGFVGIQGFPYHAFCRRYCLASYREWMHSEPDPVFTDEAGYPLPEDVVDG